MRLDLWSGGFELSIATVIGRLDEARNEVVVEISDVVGARLLLYDTQIEIDHSYHDARYTIRTEPSDTLPSIL